MPRGIVGHFVVSKNYRKKPLAMFGIPVALAFWCVIIIAGGYGNVHARTRYLPAGAAAASQQLAAPAPFSFRETPEPALPEIARGNLLGLYRTAYVAQNRINDVTEMVEDLGLPLADVYPAGESVYARNVWDLKYFAGRIFIGAGNSSNQGPVPNAGPVRRRLYDVQSGRFVDEGSVDEEQIDIYRVVNGQLYIPGHDPRQSWRLGNYYTRNTAGTWNKFRHIPAALHNYDMARFGGSLVAALGIDGGGGILRSVDDGRSWQGMYEGSHRFYSFLKANGTLFGASIFVSNSSRPPADEGGGLVEITGAGGAVPRYDIGIREIFPDTTFSDKKVLKIVRTLDAGNKGVYVGAYVHNDHHFVPFGVYVASSLQRNGIRVRRIPLPDNTFPWDVLVDQGYLYVLLEGSDGKPGRLIQVVKTALDSVSRPVEILRFRYDAFARSFEIADGDFYFGMGCEVNDPLAYSAEELNANTGRLLRVRKSLLE